MGKKDGKKNKDKQPKKQMKPDFMTEEEWELFQSPADLIQNLRGLSPANTAPCIVPRVTAAQWLTHHAFNAVKRREMMSLGVVPQAIHALYTVEPQHKSSILALIRVLSQDKDVLEELLKPRSNPPNPPLVFIPMLFRMLENEMAGSAAFEVSAAATVCNMAADPELPKCRAKVLSQVLSDTKTWVNVIGKTSSAEARADAITTLLLLLEPNKADFSHIQGVKDACVDAGCIEICFDILRQRGRDICQGSVSHGDRALQAAARLLQKLLTDPHAKEAAFKLGGLDILIDFLEIQKLGIKKKNSKWAKLRRKSARRKLMSKSKKKIELPPTDGVVTPSMLTKACVVGALFILVMPAHFTDQQIDLFSDYARLARPNPPILPPPAQQQQKPANPSPSMEDERGPLVLSGPPNPGAQVDKNYSKQPGDVSGLSKAAMNQGLPIRISDRMLMESTLATTMTSNAFSYNDESGSLTSHLQRQQQQRYRSDYQLRDLKLPFLSPPRKMKPQEMLDRFLRLPQPKRGGEDDGYESNSSSGSEMDVVRELRAQTVDALQLAVQLVAETGVLPILVSLCKGPKQLRLDEKLAKQKVEADAKAEKELAMGEDQDPGVVDMFRVPAIEEDAEGPEEDTETDGQAMKVSIQLSEHNVEDDDEDADNGPDDADGVDGNETEAEDASNKKKKKKKKKRAKKKSKAEKLPPGMGAMQEQACGCLRWMSMFHEHCEEMMKLGAVPVVRDLLNSKSSEVKAHARAVLLNIGECPESATLLQEAKVPSYLLQLTKKIAPLPYIDGLMDPRPTSPTSKRDRLYQSIAAAPGMSQSMDLSNSGLYPRMVKSASQNTGSMRDAWHLDAGQLGQRHAQIDHLPVYSLALREVAYSPLNHIHFDLPRSSMSSNMKSRIGASLTLPPLMSNGSQIETADPHKYS